MKKYLIYLAGLLSVALAYGQPTPINGVSHIVAGTNVTISPTSGTGGAVTINASGGGGSGTVTSVSVTTANGVSGSVATATTTPAITLTLGAITPSSVASTGAVSGTTGTLSSTTSLLLGTAGSAVGNIGFRNATSGTATLAPPTGALGTYSITLPNAASTLPIFGQQITFTGPTAARSFALPDSSATLLTDASAVTVAQGGTGRATGTTAYSLVATGTTATGAQQTLANGATTEVLVGGGASALPVWTTATGTGAPVRAGTPTLTTPNIGAATGTSLVLTGAVTTGSGGGVSGTFTSTEGTAPSLTANAFSIYSPTDVAAGGLAYVTPAAASTGYLLATNSAGVMTLSHTAGATAATASTVVLRDSNGNISANSVNHGYTTTATAAGTTTLTVASTNLQYFTGSTTQTVVLPVTSTLVLGQRFVIENNSTGLVTVQSSGANNILIMGANTAATYTCILTSGTTAASWNARYIGSVVATGKVFNVSNSLTLAGTDGTTMTFPATSATIARTDAANTFTGTQTFSNNLVATAGANSLAPFVDSVDGVTPLNNIVETVAAGTAYTLTTTYANVDFGTTDPVVVLPNAGTYMIYALFGTDLVGATATTQVVQGKVRRTNNTAADLGFASAELLPPGVAATIPGVSVYLVGGKYTTTNTNDSITIQAQLSAALGAGTVTVSTARIWAVRAY